FSLLGPIFRPNPSRRNPDRHPLVKTSVKPGKKRKTASPRPPMGNRRPLAPGQWMAGIRSVPADRLQALEGQALGVPNPVPVELFDQSGDRIAVTAGENDNRVDSNRLRVHGLPLLRQRDSRRLIVTSMD